MRRACWRPWRRTTLQHQPIIGTMTVEWHAAQDKWLVKWSGCLLGLLAIHGRNYDTSHTDELGLALDSVP